MWSRALSSLNVQNEMGCVRKLSKALAVHAVIHEGAASFDKNEPGVSENLEMMGDRRLT